MTQDGKRPHRPNLVIFMPDQLRADALGAFGNTNASTPHLDAFASNATVFTEAFSQHPVCSPSRASMFTGQYPHTLGHRTLTHLVQQGEQNMFSSLKEAGYHVAWLAPRGDTFAVGATEESVDEYGFIVEPEYGSVLSAQESVSTAEPERTWERLFYTGSRGADTVVDYDEAAIRSAELWLESPPEEPWVLFLPLIFPHCPFAVEEPWYSQHNRDGVPAPVGQKSGPEPSFMQAIRATYGIESVTEEMWREIIAVYYGMVSRIDDQFGRLQTALTKNSHDNTVTIFFTDHGEYLGDYGLIEKWPSGLDDVLLHNPLMIGGGGLPKGQRSDAMVELVDILPTVLQLAGTEVNFTQFGKSLLPLIDDPSAEHRSFAFSEGGFRVEEEPQLESSGFPYDLKAALQHCSPQTVGRAFSVRSPQWTYIYRLYESDELYDRSTDPHELVNLIDSPAHLATVIELKDSILKWLASTGDIIPLREDPRRPDVQLDSPLNQYEMRRARNAMRSS